MSISSANQEDLWFTPDGDFLIGQSGDLKTTIDSGNDFEGLKQLVIHRIFSENDAWRRHPNISADIGKYIGMSVNQELLRRIETDIINALTYDKLLSSNDITAKVLEIIPGTIAIMIFISASNQQTPLLTMAYDIQVGSILRIR